MAETKDGTIKQVTSDYLSQINAQNPPTPTRIQADIIGNMRNEFDTQNSILPKGQKWKVPDRLFPVQIANILLKLHNIKRIVTGGDNSDEAYDLLSIYQETGADEGIYVSTESVFRKLAREYCYTITDYEFKEVMSNLKSDAERVYRCNEPNLIAVNNGIFDYDTKTLLPFTPNKVFIAKSKVNYNKFATNVVIHNDEDGTDWDVESWMGELSDDTDVVELFWQILGAIIRPFVPWNKSAWFYSEKGNNGKGTLCELMRQLCGNGTYASIALADMGKDFMLEPLTRATAIIVDENDVGTFIDKAANLKAIVTGDVLQVNRKFKQPIAYQFKGFMVQCLNEMPRIKDKSDSFYRRQLFIPFTKCFTGIERKYIKADYLHRPEVLEYVLHKVLHMNYYELSTPQVCEEALNEYKEFNDPTRQFIHEMLDKFVWDLVPSEFLYDLYNVWYERNYAGNKQTKGNITFGKDVKAIISDSDEWEFKESVKTSTRMDEPEPLIKEYNLTKWMNQNYISSRDWEKMCCPTRPVKKINLEDC